MKNWDDYVLFDAPIHILFLLHILIHYFIEIIIV